MEMLTVRQLNFTYPKGKSPALSSVSLQVKAGEFLLLCGASGSGKTTLLRQMKPEIAPFGKRSGTLLFCGEPVEKLPPSQSAAAIGYVGQDPHSGIVTDKVWHELAFGLENLGTDPRTIRRRVAEMAGFFGISHWFHRDVSTLSGGQKQLLQLASVMVMQPKLLLLDEPTAQLDPIAACSLLDTIARIHRELGTTVVMTEHRMESVFPMADRVAVMKEGRVSCIGAPASVGLEMMEENHPLKNAVPCAVRLFYQMGKEGKCPLTVAEGRAFLSQQTGGVPLPPLGENTAKCDRTSAIVAKNLWFRYEKNGPDIVKGLSFTISKGTIHCILGDNGAGKSTLLSLLGGLRRPCGGRVEIFGERLEKIPKEKRWDGLLGLLPQNPQDLFVRETLWEELTDIAKDDATARGMAAEMGLTALLDRHPYDLSGGEAQRLALGKILLLQPKILLLDEPTKGLDVQCKETLAAILRKKTAEGVTVVMVSHDLEFCAANGDMCTMLFDGEAIVTEETHSFFGENRFYTTAANRIAKDVAPGAITAEEVIARWQKGKKFTLMPDEWLGF